MRLQTSLLSCARLMLRSAGRALVPTLAVFAATGACAKQVSLGSLSMDVPDFASGWTIKPVKSGLILQKSFRKNEANDRKGAAMIEVLGPFRSAAGSFDKGFETMVGLVKGFADERPMTKSAGVTTNAHRIRADYRCCARIKDISAGQRTVGIASAKQQAFFALLDLQLEGEARKSAERDFAALVRSVRLGPDDRTFELVPREGDGGLEGVYTHLDTGVTPNVLGGMDFYSNSEITVFDPSGLYATELPGNGDVASHCRDNPTDCGLYRMTGGGLFSGPDHIEMRKVENDLGTIETETEPFAKTGDGLTIGGAEHVFVPPFEAGKTFEGTWRYFFASSGMSAASSGSVSAERILTLARDGTFRRTGWSGASVTSDAGGSTVGTVASSRKPLESGRYRVEGYALELAGKDGRTERLSLFAPDKGSDGVLVIDGSNYLKQD